MAQYCTFELGPLLLGIPADRVREVLRAQPTTPVPLAGAAIRGLMNLRGQLVLVVDLRRRFGLPDAAPGARFLNVLVHDGESLTSLLVDRAGDVLELDESRFEPVPETLQGTARSLLSGALALPKRLLLKLDADSACDV